MRAIAGVLALAALAAVAGCSGPSLDPGDAMAGTCQFKPCVCADANAPFWRVPDTAEIIWNENGRPSCPAGFVLERKQDGG